MELSQAYSLLLITLAAALLPGVARLLRLPAPVLEILFGIILGKSFFDFQLTGQWMPFLAELGFLVLMLHAGMEIDFKALGRQRPSQLAFQVLVFACTAGLALAACLALGLGVFMALVLSTTSLGLVLPILKESGMVKSPLAQSILVAATLADFLTLLLLTLYNSWHIHGVDWHMALPIPLFVGFGLLLWLGRLWAWWHPEPAQRLLLSDDPQEQGVRFSLALLFLFVAISDLAGLEPVLGAFMGGCVISFVMRQKEPLESKLSGLGFGFLIPIFFIHVGMQFDLHSIAGPGRLTASLLLLLVALGVKLLPSLLYVLQGVGLRSALQAGFLLSARLSLIVAAASIAMQAGLLTTVQKDAIVLLALLTCFIGPTVFKLLLPGATPPPAKQSLPQTPRTRL
ncbi:MAG: cation:proton antiporter [Desulfarculus sp.]|nr:cation:proton antiporter [Pseudomonadota bacterium]MBV1717740.1 cation:proton antiporter [Desulfarculus sp.]MBU4576748.1 cation:proton antiporter [Pseudomonadota bacterium]MBU4596737.1 cation:proton antiporter [Pseudomonadota bacterium]MBV1740494.1 cation:proton antiporter [Desulfarculus sp.]